MRGFPAHAGREPKTERIVAARGALEGCFSTQTWVGRDGTEDGIVSLEVPVEIKTQQSLHLFVPAQHGERVRSGAGSRPNNQFPPQGGQEPQERDVDVSCSWK